MSQRKNVVALRKEPEQETLLQTIERVARDKSVEISRLQALLEMQRSLEIDRRQIEFNQALRAVQQKIKVVLADSENPQTRSKYASYYALDKAVRPTFTEEGFSLTFDTQDEENERIKVIGTLSHIGGHSITKQVTMPADGRGAKGGEVMTRTHATMSAITYGMRAILKMAFNIATIDRQFDDDGNMASTIAISKEQAETIKKQLGVAKLPQTKFCKKYGIKKIELLPVESYDQAIEAIADYVERSKKAAEA